MLLVPVCTQSHLFLFPHHHKYFRTCVVTSCMQPGDVMRVQYRKKDSAEQPVTEGIRRFVTRQVRCWAMPTSGHAKDKPSMWSYSMRLFRDRVSVSVCACVCVIECTCMCDFVSYACAWQHTRDCLESECLCMCVCACVIECMCMRVFVSYACTWQHTRDQLQLPQSSAHSKDLLMCMKYEAYTTSTAGPGMRIVPSRAEHSVLLLKHTYQFLEYQSHNDEPLSRQQYRACKYVVRKKTDFCSWRSFEKYGLVCLRPLPSKIVILLCFP